MNLIIKNQRQLLPKNTQKLLEHKEKISRKKVVLIISIAGGFIFAMSLFLFPAILKKAAPYVAPIYGDDSSHDAVLKYAFSIKKIEGKDIATVLHDNNIQEVNISHQKQIAELIVRPQVNEQSVQNADGRVLRLRNYLIGRGSPMVNSASTFINVADKYHFDWKLLPGIAETESNLGKVIPINSDGSLTYNPFGWGIYGSLTTGFSSWDDAIQTVAAGLIKAYGVANLKPSIMEQTYTPPSYYGTHHWMYSVQEVMSEL